MPCTSSSRRRRRPRGAGFTTSLLVAGLAAGCGVFAACAASGEGNGETSSSGSGSGGGFFDGGSGGGIDVDSACAFASDEAQPVPLNVYIMFDTSGSMAGTKWFNSSAALQAFFMDPQSAGLRVALRFFPVDGCDESCNVGACAQPKVPLGELTALSAPTDVQEDALINAFVGVAPQGETPLSAALDGALQWTTGYLNGHPGEKAGVILVTDGEPTDCNTSSSYLSGAAAGALASHGALTFAIGLEGSNESLMNAIATAGGTGQAYYIGGGADVQTELVAALDDIRDATLACEYQVPSDVNGNPIEPTRVNVLYTPEGATKPDTIGQVNGHADCGDGGGWYYDNAGAPTKITFCPATCTAIQTSEGGKVELVFGCETIPA
jgi:hypothetical protein